MGAGKGRPPVVRGVSLCLAHVPDLVRYGSKPSRDLPKDPALSAALARYRRGYKEALVYAPNQVFIGNLTPEQLWEFPKPWYQNSVPEASRFGPHGELMPQEDFYCLMKYCDDFDLLWLSQDFLASALKEFDDHPLIDQPDLGVVGAGRTEQEIAERVAAEAAIPLFVDQRLVGCFLHGHPEDPSLRGEVLLENLAAKASAVLAMRHVLSKTDGVSAGDVDYLLGCGEEAVGDRYNRGGGSLSKAIGEKAGCERATGSDVKAFCCGPNHALVIGGALIDSGLFDYVAVVGGGSLGKLGMKYQGHLKHDMPILEDVLGAVAVILGPDDGRNPLIDLACVGKHDIGVGSSQQAIADAIVLKPLDACGLRLIDIDRFATELHNPEVTLPQGSGNVPRTNYRILASLAARRNEIERDQIDEFVRRRGMPGYSPTQGHIASAIPYLAHARDELLAGTIERAFFFAKGSLFLGRMTELADGLSFLLRRNTAQVEISSKEA